MDDDAQNLISGDGFELCATEALRISAQFYNTLIVGESGSVTVGSIKADSVNGLRWITGMGAICEGTAFWRDWVATFMRVHDYGRFVTLSADEMKLCAEKTKAIRRSLQCTGTAMRVAGNSLQNAVSRERVSEMSNKIQGSLNSVRKSCLSVTDQQDILATALTGVDATRDELNRASEVNAGTAATVTNTACTAITTCKRNVVSTIHTATTLNEMASRRTQG